MNRPGRWQTFRTHVAIGLWPARCLVCAAAGENGLDLCYACAADLPWNDVACAHCGLPLPTLEPACGQCLQLPPPYSRTWAPLRYAAPLDLLLPRFKFHAGLAEGRLLSALLLARRAGLALDAVDAIVPMPLHRKRLAQRGYNQALELARPLAHAWRLPLRIDALQRVRDTAAQSKLDAEARRRNVRGAFQADARAVEGRGLLLVDDVITTGATVREAAATLLAAGAREVQVLAAARVE